MEYIRPEIAEETKKVLIRAAVKINSITDQRIRLAYVVALVGENAQLLAEVNDHRIARGYQPLPIYDPASGKK